MPTLTGTGTGLAIMIDILLRVSVVQAIGIVLAGVVRRKAALRHAILVAGLIAAFLVPAAMLSMQMLSVAGIRLRWLGGSERDDSAAVAAVGSQALSEPHEHPATPGPSASATVRAESDAPRPERGRIELSGRWIAGGLISAWVFGMVVRVAGLGRSLVRLRGMTARARPVSDDRVLALLGVLERRIPMRRPPRLMVSDEVSAPIAAGVIGNDVLVPSGWVESLRPRDAEAVLRHECAHLARRDHRVVILQELFASVLWFHPLTPLFNRMLNRAREEVCDNYAIAVVDRVSYCEALLLLAVGRPGAAPRGATSVWTRRWSLEARIRGILDERRPMGTGISRLARSAIVTLSAATCGIVALPRLTASAPNERLAAGSALRGRAGSAPNLMTRSLNKSFPVDGEKPLHIENLAGRVELAPGRGPLVEVEAILRVSELLEGDVKRLIEDIRWVEAPAEHGGSRWGLALPEGRYPKVRYPVSGESPRGVTTVIHLGREIQLSDRPGASIPAVEFDLRIAIPPEARLAIHNAVGPVAGADLVAPIEVSTYAGSIQLRNVKAPVTATSDRGAVMITDLASDATLRTGEGGIELTRFLRGRADLATRSGGCRIIEPADAAFTLRYTGIRPAVVFADGVRRDSPGPGGPRTESISRGAGGPNITVDAGAGDCIIETLK